MRQGPSERVLSGHFLFTKPSFFVIRSSLFATIAIARIVKNKPTMNVVFICVFRRSSSGHNACLCGKSSRVKERFSCCMLQSHSTYESWLHDHISSLLCLRLHGVLLLILYASILTTQGLHD